MGRIAPLSVDVCEKVRCFPEREPILHSIVNPLFDAPTGDERVQFIIA